MTLETDKVTAAHTILQRSVCLVLTCGGLGNSRKVDLRDIEMRKAGQTLDHEKRELGASKQLFQNADLQPCNRTMGSAKDYLRSMAVSGHRVFGAGTYLVPVPHVQPVEERLSQYQADLAGHAEALARRLPEILAQRREALGPLFSEQDYPTADQVREQYAMDWTYVTFAAPERLVEVDRYVYERTQAKYQRRLAAAYEEVVVGLRESALLVMRELANKLKPNRDGKAKALQPTALRDLQDLLSRLPVLDMAGDEALQGIMARVAAIGSGLDVETLRAAPGVRAMLLERAEAAVAQLDGLVSSGGRAMTFEPL